MTLGSCSLNFLMEAGSMAFLCYLNRMQVGRHSPALKSGNSVENYFAVKAEEELSGEHVSPHEKRAASRFPSRLLNLQ